MTEIHFSHSNPSDYRRIKIMQKDMKLNGVRVSTAAGQIGEVGNTTEGKCIVCA